MTFTAGALSLKGAQIRNMVENLQLLSLNQLSMNNLQAQEMVNGFTDKFQDEEGIDLSLSAARHDPLGKFFTGFPGQTGLTHVIQIDPTADIETSGAGYLSVNDDGIGIKKVLISNGALNGAIGFATPAMSSNLFPVPCTIMASSEYVSPNCPAWRAFDHNEHHSTNPEESWIAMSTATETVLQWIKIDFGPNSGKIINKYSIQSRNSPDPAYVAAPRNFELRGSNDDSIWDTLDSAQDFPELPSNTWSDYRTFENDIAYRYYQFRISSSWGTGLTSLSQLKLVEASCMVPNSPEAAILSGPLLLNWSNITNVSPNFSTPGSSKIFCALSFNKDTDSKNWKIWDGSVWKNIAQLDFGKWKYLNNSWTWVDSTANARLETLRQALEQETNQMDIHALASINENFSQIFVPNKIAIAIEMMADENDEAPYLGYFTVTHDEIAQELDLISRPYGASFPITGAYVSFLVKNMSPGASFYMGVGEDAPSWIKLTGYSKKTTLTNQTEYYSASLSDTEELAGPVRLRVTAPAGVGVEIHGWAMNWDN